MCKQESFRSIKGWWVWVCNQGHENDNTSDNCKVCNERITCVTAGGHHDTKEPRGFCDRCEKNMAL